MRSRKNKGIKRVLILIYVTAVLITGKCIYMSYSDEINGYIEKIADSFAYSVVKTLFAAQSGAEYTVSDNTDYYKTAVYTSVSGTGENISPDISEYELKILIENENSTEGVVSAGKPDEKTEEKQITINYAENNIYKAEENNVAPESAEEKNSDEDSEGVADNEKSGEDYVMAGSGAVKMISAHDMIKEAYQLELLENFNYLISNYYIVDSSTKAVPSVFNGKELLAKDLSIDKPEEGNEEVQILIYHTHGSETYADSREGKWEDTIAGPGEYLTQLLEDKGYNVYHDKTCYDMKDGKDNRNYAYSTARPAIEKFLENNKSVQVIIDLHRDAGEKRVTTINGESVAQVMFFNGLCRNQDGPLVDLPNPYIASNLAFSLQANLVGRVLYPGLMYKIYLKNYRYNQHFSERYMLIELGTNGNTVSEAYNAMPYLADVLDVVLSGKAQ